MRILCIGDVHAPFIDKTVFSKILQRLPVFKPHLIIQMGDLYDHYSWSRFPKKLINPNDEIIEAYGVASEFWRLIRKTRPRAKLIQLRGNHDQTRIDKIVASKAPELAPFISTSQFWEFPGVEVIHDTKEPFIHQGIAYTHGHRTRLEPHLMDFNYQYSVVIGHLHRGFTEHVRVGNKTLFACCAGYIADPMSEGLNYRPLNKFLKWTPGVTEIEYGSPRFIAL